MNSLAPKGSIFALTLLSIGAFFVILLVIYFALNFDNQTISNKLFQPTVGSIPASSPAAVAHFGAGGYPITPTPFQPLPTSTPTFTPSPSPTLPPTLLPTLPPTEISVPQIPSSTKIEGIRGFPQTLNLSCESRSAVDWAAYFGVSILELEFLANLPSSDDPNKGFVGNPNGPGGLIPPNPYGVHAAPVAALLRAYGLPAEDVVGLTPEQIKAEIAAGQPVIVWIIFGTSPGYAVNYTTSTGEVVKVAPNEHTAIIIGYDERGVTLLDGAVVYWRSWDAFLQSFAVLDNMAIIYDSP